MEHQMDKQDAELATTGAPPLSEMPLGTASAPAVELHFEAPMGLPWTSFQSEALKMNAALSEEPTGFAEPEVQDSDRKMPQAVNATEAKVRTRGMSKKKKTSIARRARTASALQKAMEKIHSSDELESSSESLVVKGGVLQKRRHNPSPQLTAEDRKQSPL